MKKRLAKIFEHHSFDNRVQKYMEVSQSLGASIEKYNLDKSEDNRRSVINKIADFYNIDSQFHTLDIRKTLLNCLPTWLSLQVTHYMQKTKDFHLKYKAEIDRKRDFEIDRELLKIAGGK